jgi:hypothetical protein
MLKSLPTQPAFYKQQTKPSEFWSVGLEKVENANYTLLIEDHAEYDYPVDGWEYHVTPPAAFVTWYNENFPPDPEEE